MRSLDEALAPSDAEIDLAEAALILASDEYPGLLAADYLSRLDELANEIATRLPSAFDTATALCALNRQLYDTEGFSGNAGDYYDPRNSYLNQVLERRLGIPITLSVVYLEVGWRLDLPLRPISFPSHFLVGCESDSGVVLIDTFDRGRRISTDEAMQRLQPVLGDRADASQYLPQALGAVSRRDVIGRMLRNLKAIYASRQEWERTLRVSSRMISVYPSDPIGYRDRAALHAHLECFRAALDDYDRYLDLAPQAPDAATVRARRDAAAHRVSRLN